MRMLKQARVEAELSLWNQPTECRFTPEIDAFLNISVEEITTDRAEMQQINQLLANVYAQRIDCNDFAGK